MPVQNPVVVNRQVATLADWSVNLNFSLLLEPLEKCFLTGTSNWCYVSGLLPDWHSSISSIKVRVYFPKIPGLLISIFSSFMELFDWKLETHSLLLFH